MESPKTQHVSVPSFNLKDSISQAVNEMRAASELAAVKVLFKATQTGRLSCDSPARSNTPKMDWGTS